MLRALLEKDPKKRPSIREAKERFVWLQRPVFPSEQEQPEPSQDKPKEVKPVEQEDDSDSDYEDDFEDFD